MKTFSSLILITLLAAAPACSKKEEAPAAPAPTTAPAATTPTPAEPAAKAPTAQADFIAVHAVHKKPKPDDPVVVRFEKFNVTKSSFDPANLEGGTATIELDLASINSASAKRDDHLKSPSYIDLGKFATATIDVANVKKSGGSTYGADAKVKFRDIEKTYPVTFEVIGTTPDSVTIRGEQPFDRLDFGVGKDPADADESVGASLTLKLQLTLKKA